MFVDLINQICVSLMFVFICSFTSYGYIPNIIGNTLMILLASTLLINHNKFYK